MSEQSLAKPHDIAAGEINSWRGHCLDLFAKGERAIASTLEIASDPDPSLTIKHLAGQRLADLAKLVMDQSDATDKQSKAILSALDGWLNLEAKRAFIAHGVATVLLDRQGGWHVRFDFTKYQAKRRERQSWCCSAAETAEVEEELEQALKVLSTQLGQFRKRISP